MGDSRFSMFNVVGWTIVITFVVTTIITLLALVGVIQLADSTYLGRLFTVLIIEVIAAGFFLFRWGMKPSNRPNESTESKYFERSNALYQSAIKEKNKGNTEEADRLLGEILRLSIDDLPFEIRNVFRERGELAFDKKLWLQATNAYGTYFEIAPDDFEVLVRYGRCLRETNRYSDAVEIYERAQRMSPNNYDVLNGLQNILRRMGGFFQEADRADAAEPYYEKARGYINSMLKIASAAKADKKRYANAVLARARLYWQWERYPEAIAAYKDIISEDPRFSLAKEDLAAVYLEYSEKKNNTDLIEESYKLYEQLLNEVDTVEDRVFIGAGMAEAVAKLPDASSQQIERAEHVALGSLAHLDTTQEDPYPFYAIAVLFMKKGEHEDAIRYLKDAIRHERHRASDPYRFDYVRLVKYEKLLQKWEAFN